MKPRWKSIVELFLGLGATILVTPLLVKSIDNSNWFLVAITLVAILFWTNMVRNAWNEI